MNPDSKSAEKKWVKTSHTGAVTTWLIDRPERGNAIGPSVAEELLACTAELDEALKSPQPSTHPLSASLPVNPRILLIRCATVRRAGKRPIWSAGGDLKELQEIRSREDCLSFARTVASVCSWLETADIAVVAALDGLAMGGSAEFALAADLRIVSADGGFVFPQLDIGLATGFGGAQRLVAQVGRSTAQKLLYLGETYLGQDAVRIGLAHHCCPSEEDLELYLKQLCQKIQATSAASLASQKKMIRQANTLDAFDEVEEFSRIWRNPNHSRFLDRFAKAKAD